MIDGYVKPLFRNVSVYDAKQDQEKSLPRRLYERQGRVEEYRDAVERLKAERVARLEEFPDLTPEIVKAAG